VFNLNRNVGVMCPSLPEPPQDGVVVQYFNGSLFGWPCFGREQQTLQVQGNDVPHLLPSTTINVTAREELLMEDGSALSRIILSFVSSKYELVLDIVLSEEVDATNDVTVKHIKFIQSFVIAQFIASSLQGW
jgi:hypothetical protein